MLQVISTGNFSPKNRTHVPVCKRTKSPCKVLADKPLEMYQLLVSQSHLNLNIFHRILEPTRRRWTTKLTQAIEIIYHRKQNYIKIAKLKYFPNILNESYSPLNSLSNNIYNLFIGRGSGGGGGERDNLETSEVW